METVSPLLTQPEASRPVPPSTSLGHKSPTAMEEGCGEDICDFDEHESALQEAALQRLANSVPFMPLLVLWYTGGVLCVATSKVRLF